MHKFILIFCCLLVGCATGISPDSEPKPIEILEIAEAETAVTEISPDEEKGIKTFPADTFYLGSYSPSNIPRYKRYQTPSRQEVRFRGVRDCGRRRAQSSAEGRANYHKDELLERVPSYEVVRFGWFEGSRYQNNTGGGWGGSGRSCNGWVTVQYFVDVKR